MEILIIVFYFIISGILNRLGEITVFEGWFYNSVFINLENKFPRIYRWLRSWDVDEWRFLKIGKFKLPLHPIFWDLYHFTKNMDRFLLSIYVFYVYGWQLTLAVLFFWWIMQIAVFKICLTNIEVENES
ncbi:hypothetical protein Calab_1519 [Caldithrix abyssi DSM 13497]|uniref:Glycosyl-4,4'-diaponeurosporenoate acyltransferase n=2 Tax=Caldithrix abyssi TaxID=187145 RepID=H1XTE6_CALAY|nr:hypothetical protein [Caldithrix abyssi]APF16982.1 hypothetical protein Cabys_231 [Caldithrix abyssi DSM 13497]APF20329.1 hypothetical protein Cabys_3583 [Caldithrix abyssi DSM 13497]EHO40379.1 hypothetical protein Calab_0740 [Caldithrix abyssi DSM 13497]EHO41139.1 hypothetical protein Calab_1519 [Caldithrix abyssi DSM 13497]